jgi:ABC-type phosphate/phosphonate transport system permease subunit
MIGHSNVFSLKKTAKMVVKNFVNFCREIDEIFYNHFL